MNILGEDHVELSNLFAKKGADRFSQTPWRIGVSGAPVLDCRHGRVTAVITGLLTGHRLSFLPADTVVPTPWGSPTNAAVPARALAALQGPDILAEAARRAQPGSLTPEGQSGLAPN